MSYYAFFDLDETIIKTKSMIKVIKTYFELKNWQTSDSEFERFMKKMKNFDRDNGDRVELNKFYYKQLAGICSKELEMASQSWFYKSKDKILNAPVIKEINKHRDLGAEIVVVTGSFWECVKPILEYLNIDTVICAQLEKNGEYYTGEMLCDPTIGLGKSKAILAYVQEGKYSLRNSYGYADDESDIAMLSEVDNAYVVGKNEKLLSFAREKNWTIIN